MRRRLTHSVAVVVVCLGLFAAPLAGAAPSVSGDAISVGGAENGVRPELNGKRLSPVGKKDVYLVLDGKRRQVPNTATYRNLFCDWSDIVEVIDIDAIADGGALSDGATLMRARRTETVYLVSNGVKRPVAEKSMRKYNFCWDKVNNVAKVVVDAIPDGVGIS